MHKTYFKPPKGHRKNPKYLKAVKQLPCFYCNLPPPSEAHHIIGGGYGGMGLKAPDTMTMPLCRLCHGKIHKDYDLFDQEEAVKLTYKKIIAFGLI